MQEEITQKFYNALENVFSDFSRKRQNTSFDESTPPKLTKNVQSTIRPYQFDRYEELGSFNLLRSNDRNTYIFRKVDQKSIEAPSKCANESNDSNKFSVNENLALKSIENQQYDSTLGFEGNDSRSTRASNVQNTKPNNAGMTNSADVRVESSSTERSKVLINTLRLESESGPLCKKLLSNLDKRYSSIQARKYKILELQNKVNEQLKNRIVKNSKEVDDFPELSEDQLKEINNLINGDDTKVIKKFGIQVTREDLLRLRWDQVEKQDEEEGTEDKELNDNVINFYMKLLVERPQLRSRHGYPKVYAMDTIFCKRLQNDGYTAVRKYTKNHDIFTYNIILVPVHVNEQHWCMAVIDMEKETIKYYDSLFEEDNHDSLVKVNITLSALENYLKEESKDKRKEELDFSGWSKEIVTNHPQQDNDYDCGVFSCMTAEFICRKRPIAFEQENMDYFRKKMILEIGTGKMIL